MKIVAAVCLVTLLSSCGLVPVSNGDRKGDDCFTLADGEYCKVVTQHE